MHKGEKKSEEMSLAPISGEICPSPIHGGDSGAQVLPLPCFYLRQELAPRDCAVTGVAEQEEGEWSAASTPHGRCWLQGAIMESRAYARVPQ